LTLFRDSWKAFEVEKTARKRALAAQNFANELTLETEAESIQMDLDKLTNAQSQTVQELVQAAVTKERKQMINAYEPLRRKCLPRQKKSNPGAIGSILWNRKNNRRSQKPRQRRQRQLYQRPQFQTYWQQQEQNDEQQWQNKAKEQQTDIERQVKHSLRFIPNLRLSRQHNISLIIAALPALLLSSQPANPICHNFCINTRLPANTTARPLLPNSSTESSDVDIINTPSAKP
jgi:hypothetical protein